VKFCDNFVIAVTVTELTSLNFLNSLTTFMFAQQFLQPKQSQMCCDNVWQAL